MKEKKITLPTGGLQNKKRKENPLLTGKFETKKLKGNKTALLSGGHQNKKRKEKKRREETIPLPTGTFGAKN
jgi:hypothetical protein